MAFIEASLEELLVSANLGQSCLATKINAPGPSSFGWFRHIKCAIYRMDEGAEKPVRRGEGGARWGCQWRPAVTGLILWRNHPKLLGPGALIFVAKQL